MVKTMVRILAGLRLAKMPMARPSEPNMPPKPKKNGAIKYFAYPNLAK